MYSWVWCGHSEGRAGGPGPDCCHSRAAVTARSCSHWPMAWHGHGTVRVVTACSATVRDRAVEPQSGCRHGGPEPPLPACGLESKRRVGLAVTEGTVTASESVTVPVTARPGWPRPRPVSDSTQFTAGRSRVRSEPEPSDCGSPGRGLDRAVTVTLAGHSEGNAGHGYPQRGRGSCWASGPGPPRRSRWRAPACQCRDPGAAPATVLPSSLTPAGPSPAAGQCHESGPVGSEADAMAAAASLGRSLESESA